MSTFYIKKEQIKNNEIEIIGDDINHIKNVLRYKIGDNIDLCDETGTKYKTKIVTCLNDKIITQIEKEYKQSNEPQINITLFQGLPKANKMEYIIQKATELGVKEIVPVEMKRSIVKVDEKAQTKKIERWQKISKEAAMQSGRNKIPKIYNVVNLKNIVEKFEKYDIVLLPYEYESENSIKNILSSVPKEAKNIAIIIGPEGGFDEQEIKILKTANVKIVTLGPRILRTETAGIATISMVMYEFEL